jgi:hypothetical protein
VKGPLDLFRRLERELRTPRERLPIDAFLPPAETLPTEFPDPPPSALPSEVRELGTVADAEEERRERRRRQRRIRKAAAPEAPPEAPKKLEEEIQEFINRDRPPGTRPEELSEFLGGFDPSDIPEEK